MLCLQNLSLGYRGAEVLHLSEFSLRAGQHCLVTGPSGSGKTTLLYAIAGLLSPRSGVVRVADTDITQLSERARDRFRGMHMGMIHQALHLVPTLTVLQNILLAAFAVGMKQEVARAVTLLRALELSDVESFLPAQLSYGQQQRVAIARAVMNRPMLLIGDEPTSALDDAAQQAVIRLLFSVAEECHATLLIASHDARIRSCFSHHLSLGDAL